MAPSGPMWIPGFRGFSRGGGAGGGGANSLPLRRHGYDDEDKYGRLTRRRTPQGILRSFLSLRTLKVLLGVVALVVSPLLSSGQRRVRADARCSSSSSGEPTNYTLRSKSSREAGSRKQSYQHHHSLQPVSTPKQSPQPTTTLLSPNPLPTSNFIPVFPCN